MLEDLKNKNKTVGARQSLKAVENGKVKIAYIAQDAEEHVVAKIKELCKKDLIDIVYVESMKMLGKSCGIAVGASVVCELK